MPTLTKNYENIATTYNMGGLSGANLKLYAKYNSQSINDNSSSVSAKLTISCASGTAFHCYTHSCEFTPRPQYGGLFDGSDWKGSYYHGWESNTETTILEQTITIKHNDDGTKSFSLGGSFSCSAPLSGSVSNVTCTLPKIDRISPIVSFSGNDVEGNFSSTFTQYVSSYTQKLRISIPYVQVIQTFDNYTNGSNVTLNSSAISAIQTYMNNNSTNQVTLGGVIETWNGSTKIGESSEIRNVCTFSNANPTISNTETETEANVITYYGSGASTIVQNASKVRCEVTATALKGASISSVVIRHNNVDYPTTLSSGKYVATIPMSANSFVITATDNRRNVSTKTVTKTMVNYAKVDFGEFTIKRVNATSSNIRFDIEATYYQQTFGSTANVPIVKYKLGSGNFVTIPSTEYTIDNTNHKLSISNYVVNNLLVYTDAGQFTLYIEDKLTNDTEGGTKAYVTKGVPTFEAGDTDFQVNGELYIADTDRNNAKEIRDLIYPIGSIYLSVNNVNPSTLFGGTWVAFGTGRTLVGVDTNQTEFNSVEKTGGHKDLQSHSHTIDSATLTGSAGNYLMDDYNPYITSSGILGIGGRGGSEGRTWKGDTSSNSFRTLNINASHGHSMQNAGSGDSGNLQPYITCYMWKRTE